MTDTLIRSRREVLKAGSLIVAFSLTGGARTALAQQQNTIVPDATAKPVAMTEVDSFLAIDASGAVTVYSGKVDLGTGVKTALTQIVADELDVSMPNVHVVQGDTLATPDQGPTFGSVSIQIGGMQIRNAAALARVALLEAAATALNARLEELRIENGVIAGPTGQMTFGQLIGGKTFNLKVDHTKPPPWKDAKAYKYVGTSVARLDIPDKVTGRFTYMHDVRVPDMLHGRVVRPPAIGAQLETVDEDFDQGRPGHGQASAGGQFPRRRRRERVERDPRSARSQGHLVGLEWFA